MLNVAHIRAHGSLPGCGIVHAHLHAGSARELGGAVLQACTQALAGVFVETEALSSAAGAAECAQRLHAHASAARAAIRSALRGRRSYMAAAKL